MDNKDEQLWRIAKKRVEFKRHLATYIIINGFLWALWFFTGQEEMDEPNFPWPIWSTIGWGIGLAFSYVKAYHSNVDAVEKEYQKLKEKG